MKPIDRLWHPYCTLWTLSLHMPTLNLWLYEPYMSPTRTHWHSACTVWVLCTNADTLLILCENRLTGYRMGVSLCTKGSQATGWLSACTHRVHRVQDGWQCVHVGFKDYTIWARSKDVPKGFTGYRTAVTTCMCIELTGWRLCACVCMYVGFPYYMIGVSVCTYGTRWVTACACTVQRLYGWGVSMCIKCSQGTDWVSACVCKVHSVWAGCQQANSTWTFGSLLIQFECYVMYMYVNWLQPWAKFGECN